MMVLDVEQHKLVNDIDFDYCSLDYCNSVMLHVCNVCRSVVYCRILTEKGL